MCVSVCDIRVVLTFLNLYHSFIQSISALSHRSEVSNESWNEKHQSDGEEEPARLVEEEGTDVVGDGVLDDDADLQLRSRQDEQDEILDIVRHAHQDHGHQQRQECQDLKI